MDDGKVIETKYGLLHGISLVEVYPDGNIKECVTDERLELDTDYGKLIPQYENEEVRRRYMKTLTFYQNGSLKKIALQEQTVIKTGIGSVKAEQVQFYDDGSIKRIFPLNGKITGYWTEDNEYELAESISFNLECGNFEKKAINILFYKSGKVKSITFWPKEQVSILAPQGRMGIRYGLSIYESGKLKSLEPAYPVVVKTPIGGITAFDVNAIGINGDMNSLNFYEDGTVQSLLTTTDILIFTDKQGRETVYKPKLVPRILEEGMEILPLQIQFKEEYIHCAYSEYNFSQIEKNNTTEEGWFSIKEYKITIKNGAFIPKNTCGNCAGCTGCG